ncbi:MAG: glycosyltransferase [Planctomycetota bacterium]
MRILCNLPLECFDDRDAMRGIELLTYGPPERMLVDGVHHRFDVAFDPSRQTWAELARALPDGFEPDLVLIWWPDQEPIPDQLEHCPVPVVGIISDYNLTLPHIVGLWPYFDTLLCDKRGVELFQRLSFADVQHWCQFAHKRPTHRIYPEIGERDIDLGFAGNLNPVVQRERGPWLERLRALSAHGPRIEVTSGIAGADYGRFLNRCRIGFNRSIRGEMNLRGFEVPACGALLLMERDNAEVRDWFVPEQECVLYDEQDFEDVVERLLKDPARTAEIAAAGHRRVQEHRLGNRLHELSRFAKGPLRRPDAEPVDLLLGRGMAMLPTWADGHAALRAAKRAHDAAPDDPRTLNLLGMAVLRARGADGAESAFALWRRAAEASQNYVPAAVNLATLARHMGHGKLIEATDRERARRLAVAPEWPALDGPMLPFGFDATAIDRSLALQRAVRSSSPHSFADQLRC